MTIRLLFLSIVLFAGCSGDPQGPPREFVISVDSVQAPETVFRDEPLELRFYGRIGSTLCYVFDRFEAEQSPSRLDVTLWGRYEAAPDGLCALAVSELRGLAFIKAPPHADPVIVTVHQSDGTTLEIVVSLSN